MARRALGAAAEEPNHLVTLKDLQDAIDDVEAGAGLDEHDIVDLVEDPGSDLRGALDGLYVSSGSLAAVATSGSYLDLSDTPAVPDELTDLDTSVTGSQLDAMALKLSAIEPGADVTDAENVAAAGAVMRSDTATTGFGFVVDEDNFASDTDTKVPTQQSVKAYVDAGLAAKQDTAARGQPGGYAALDATGKVPYTQLPDFAKGVNVSAQGYAETTEWRLLADLPVDDPANFASLIITGRLGGRINFNTASWSIILTNRSADHDGQTVGAAVFALGEAAGAVNPAFTGSATDIVVYAQNDKSAKVYLRLVNYYTYDLNVMAHQATLSYTGSSLTSEPPGTLVWTLSGSPYSFIDTDGVLHTPVLDDKLDTADLDASVAALLADGGSSSRAELDAAFATVAYVDGELADKADAAHTHTIGDVDGLAAALDGKQAALGYIPENSAHKGQPGGYASLDSGGKIPVAQLPNSIMEYKGVWDAADNDPPLTDGIGNTGDVYRVAVGGTVDLGSGPIEFSAGDYVIYNGSTWEKSDTTDSVVSVAGLTGPISASALREALDVEEGADVTDAENVAAAGAVMRSDTTTTGFGFVVDEDNMASDTDTKVPTQQSVKAYVDAGLAAKADAVHTHTGSDIVDLADALEAELAGVVHGLTEKLSPLHTSDELMLLDSDDGFALKRLTLNTLLTVFTNVVSSTALTMTNKTLTDPRITGYRETLYQGGNTGSAVTINLANGTVQQFTLTDDCTFTMPAAPGPGLSRSFTVLLHTGQGGFEAEFSGVKWPGDEPPQVSADGDTMDVFTFVCDGDTWYGSCVQGYAP